MEDSGQQQQGKQNILEEIPSHDCSQEMKNIPACE